MSYHDYLDGQRVAVTDCTFYGLIQAAMRRADSDNLDRLQRAFPRVWDDLARRYNAPGGLLPGEDFGAMMDDVARQVESDRRGEP